MMKIAPQQRLLDWIGKIAGWECRWKHVELSLPQENEFYEIYADGMPLKMWRLQSHFSIILIFADSGLTHLQNI